MNALSPNYPDTYVADGAPDGPVSHAEQMDESFRNDVAAAYVDQQAVELLVQSFDAEFDRLMDVASDNDAVWSDWQSLRNMASKLQAVRKILER